MTKALAISLHLADGAAFTQSEPGPDQSRIHYHRPDGARGPNATQRNLAGTGIGTFNDRLRDAVRGGGPFDSDGRELSGSDVDYPGQPAGYTEDPQENIVYISKHDNQTLWDNTQYKLPLDLQSRDRARLQIVGLSTVALAQGGVREHGALTRTDDLVPIRKGGTPGRPPGKAIIEA